MGDPVSEPTPRRRADARGRASATPEPNGSPGEALLQRLSALRIGPLADNATRLAALNLMEDAVMARRAELEQSAARQRAQDDLSERDQRLRLALDAAQMGTFVWHVGEERLQADARMLALVGLTADDAPSLEALRAMVVEPDDEACARGFESALDPDGTGELRQDFRVRLPDGSTRWLTIHGRIGFEGDPPRAARLAGVAIDVTERREHEDALRDSGERLRALFDSMTEAFVVLEALIDDDGDVTDFRFVECNPAFERQTGLSDPIGRTVRDAMPGIDPVCLEHYAEVLHTGRPAQFEAQVHPTERWSSFSATRLGGPRSRRVAIVFTDVTERRRAEHALRASEERLRLVVDNAREYAIIAMDRDRRVTAWNAGAEAILGYAQWEIVDRRADVIFTAEDRAAGAPQRESQRAIDEGRAGDERWHLRKDGSRFWGSGVMMPMLDEHGTPLGFVKIMRDGTEAWEARQALEASRERLWVALQENQRVRAEVEAASAAKDEFLAVLSHELRTPLNPVMLAVHMLLMQEDLPAESVDALKMIQRNVQLEARFIDDLLDVTRISRGKMELLREPVDVHDALRRALEVAATDFAARRQDVVVALRSTRTTISGDSARLQQVFWNLLKNAAKFSPPGSSVRVATDDGPGRVVVEIADQGLGIEPDAIERIFQPFQQENRSVARRFGGLGLGLAIARATVAGHGGSLTAHSAGRDRGTTMRVELPLVSGAGPEAP